MDTSNEAPFTAAELVAAVRRAEVTKIRPVLGTAGLTRWAEDVVGDVLTAAWENRHTFDPNFDGRAADPLQAWVNTIASRRAIKLIEHERGGKNQAGSRFGDLVTGHGGDVDVTAELERKAVSEEHRAHRELYDGYCGDHAEMVAEQLDLRNRLAPIITAVGGVVPIPTFIHGLVTYTKFDGDVAEAAKRFEVAPGRIREHKRQFALHFQVVFRAWEKGSTLAGAAPTAQDLIDCLPDEDLVGAWTRQMGQAVAGWPGSVDDIRIDWLQGKTGWAYDTARQYKTITVRLFRIALQIMQSR